MQAVQCGLKKIKIKNCIGYLVGPNIGDPFCFVDSWVNTYRCIQYCLPKDTSQLIGFQTSTFFHKFQILFKPFSSILFSYIYPKKEEDKSNIYNSLLCVWVELILLLHIYHGKVDEAPIIYSKFS